MEYTPSHEWVRIEGKFGFIGITKYAVKELGEIVYIQLPPVGKKITQGEEVVVLESTKAAADVYAPIAGVVIAHNEALLQDLAALNQDPETMGWLFQIELEEENPCSDFLTLEEYLAMIRS